MSNESIYGYRSNTASLADYSTTVAVVQQLVDVRFKLVAFIPPLTGAAVGLLTTRTVAPLQQAALGLGGLSSRSESCSTTYATASTTTLQSVEPSSSSER